MPYKYSFTQITKQKTSRNISHIRCREARPLIHLLCCKALWCDGDRHSTVGLQGMLGRQQPCLDTEVKVMTLDDEVHDARIEAGEEDEKNIVQPRIWRIK